MRRGHQLVGVWPERPASAKIKTAKISSEAFPRKFAPAKISSYTVTEALVMLIKIFFIYIKHKMAIFITECIQGCAFSY